MIMDEISLAPVKREGETVQKSPGEPEVHSPVYANDIWRRAGTFCVTPEMLTEYALEQILKIFDGVLILRAENIGWPAATEYLGLSEQFDIIPEGCEPKHYWLHYDGPIDEGRFVFRDTRW